LVNDKIAGQRLDNQSISRLKACTPAGIVAWLGAVQAQEYAAARWALGLRLPAATDAALERAFDAGRILRTHVLRPTWHFVAPADIRWMLELTAPHIQRAMAYQRRELALDARTCTRAVDVIARALGEGEYLTRSELGARLARSRIVAAGNRLAHLAAYAELEGVICSGPRRGKQFTYALLATRAPGARRLPRDQALAELTRRFFQSHAPATIRDFVWWSGLATADAKRGLEMNRATSLVVDGLTYWTLGRSSAADRARAGVHLLPVYDEYVVAYRDRVAVPHWPPGVTAARGLATFQNVLVIAGQIAGTWRAVRRERAAAVDVAPLRRLSASERRSLDATVARYARFLDAPVSLSVSP
jgi:hypothetical protein